MKTFGSRAEFEKACKRIPEIKKSVKDGSKLYLNGYLNPIFHESLTPENEIYDISNSVEKIIIESFEGYQVTGMQSPIERPSADQADWYHCVIPVTEAFEVIGLVELALAGHNGKDSPLLPFSFEAQFALDDYLKQSQAVLTRLKPLVRGTEIITYIADGKLKAIGQEALDQAGIELPYGVCNLSQGFAKQ